MAERRMVTVGRINNQDTGNSILSWNIARLKQRWNLFRQTAESIETEGSCWTTSFCFLFNQHGIWSISAVFPSCSHRVPICIHTSLIGGSDESEECILSRCPLQMLDLCIDWRGEWTTSILSGKLDVSWLVETKLFDWFNNENTEMIRGEEERFNDGMSCVMFGQKNGVKYLWEKMNQHKKRKSRGECLFGEVQIWWSEKWCKVRRF